MPKRSTATFTSEDGPDADGAPLYVYYCKYSGEHCLITDAVLSSLPRRRTDGALVLDTEAAVVRLQAQLQPPKYIKRCVPRRVTSRARSAARAAARGSVRGWLLARANPSARLTPRRCRRSGEGELEKQLRYHTAAGLPFAYCTEQGGRYLYVLPDSLTSYARGASAGAVGAAVPVPPCIQRVRGEAVQVALQLEERQKAAALLAVSADAVSLAVTTAASAAGPELLELLAKALGVKAAALQVLKGWSDRSRMLLVTGLAPQRVHTALQAALEGDKARNALRAYAPPQQQPRAAAA